MSLLLGLQFFQIVLQAIEALFPEAPVVLDPGGNIPQWLGFKPAGSPLRFAAASDKAGALQHLEVLGHGGKTHIKRRGKLRD